MERLSAWLGAGLVTSGVLAAMIAGAAVAGADTDSPSDAGDATSSGPAKPGNGPSDSGNGGDKPAAGGSASASNSAGATSSGSAKPAAEQQDSKAGDGGAVVHPASEASKESPKTDDDALPSDAAEAAVFTEKVDDPDAVNGVSGRLSNEKTNKSPTPATTVTSDHPATPRLASVPVRPLPDVVQPETVVTPDEPVATAPAPLTDQNVDGRETDSGGVVASTTALRSASAVDAVTVNAVAPPQPSIIGMISTVVFNLLQTVERIVTGPPVLPPNSTVTVRSSTLEIGSGHVVPADWYYPAGDPPKQLILLQHGFLAIGPMYSYTAANLAEQTHSIVVAPTLTSNPLAVGNFWLGGAGMHEAVADLFVGNRDALTASAVAAGYAQQYGLDPTTAALPLQFALAGHSLGGALVSGVAGYLADNGAADNLAGVILLDGVPTGDQLSGALVKLATYEARTGHYVPVREIGAPWNIWNSLSNANQSLSAARPDNYNGVVLAGGVHMDSMQGGNPLIQFAAYLAAGFPQKQNPPAVQQLAVTWLEQWFAGDTHIGDGLVPGSTIEIDTPEGPARGVVIGNPPAVVASSARARQLVA